MSEKVTIRTGARLHFGFCAYRRPAAEGSRDAERRVDVVPATSRPRNYGGLGLMIDGPGFEISASPSDRDTVVDVRDSPRTFPESADNSVVARIAAAVERYRRCCPAGRRPRACRIEIRHAIPAHLGLGSGTQLGMAVGKALSLLADEIDAPAVALANRTERGKRSALGVHGFERGGFLVDGGKADDHEVAPLVARLDVPAQWRFLLVTPPRVEGLAGDEETESLKRLPDMPERLSGELCRLILMEILPAVAEADISRFGESIFQFGRLVGRHFSSVQEGEYADASMAELVAWLRREPNRGVAQTSWGPTVAICCGDAAEANLVRSRVLGDPRWAECQTRIAAALNTGASVESAV